MNRKIGSVSLLAARDDKMPVHTDQADPAECDANVDAAIEARQLPADKQQSLPAEVKKLLSRIKTYGAYLGPTIFL